jgi:ubiquinone/menaquinone biosynthesis C-methylase UbiE
MENKNTDRQLKEESYHNAAHKTGAIKRGHLNTGNTTFFKCFCNIIGEVAGLTVLEIGCGSGWFGMQLAKEGAKVCGIDISGEVIQEAFRESKIRGCAEKAAFHKMAVEDLSFKNNYFDLVVGSAILHHTDIRLAMPNVYRVLSPEGRAVFVEPLNENLALKVWRKLTPWRRSPTERALIKDDLNYIRNVFPGAAYYYFGLTSMVSMGLLMCFPKSSILNWMNKTFERLDEVISKRYPRLGHYFAVVVMELKKEI